LTRVRAELAGTSEALVAAQAEILALKTENELLNSHLHIAELARQHCLQQLDEARHS
jgi:hypothetical protein